MCRLVEPNKTRSCSRLHSWKVNAWEVFYWWTGAFVDQLVEPYKQGVVLDKKINKIKNIGDYIRICKEINRRLTWNFLEKYIVLVTKRDLNFDILWGKVHYPKFIPCKVCDKLYVWFNGFLYLDNSFGKTLMAHPLVNSQSWHARVLNWTIQENIGTMPCEARSRGFFRRPCVRL